MQIAAAAIRPRAAITPRAVLGAGMLAAVIAMPICLQRFDIIDVSAFGSVGYQLVFAMALIGSLTLFLPVPVLAIVFAASTFLNPVILAVLTAAGISIGMSVSYLLGKSGSSYFQRALNSSSGGRWVAGSRISRWFVGNATVTSYLVAALPNPLFDYAGLIAGAARVPAWRFLLGTFAGKMTQTLVVGFVGVSLAERFT